MVETGSNISSGAAVGGYSKGGSGTITAGLTSVNVAHGLGTTPAGVSVTPKTNSLGVDVYVSALDATNITVAMDFTQASDVEFYWSVTRL